MNLSLILLLSVLSAVHWSHGELVDPVTEEVILARHVQPVGDWAKVNPNQTDVQEAAQEAVKRYNFDSKKKKYFKLVDIISANTKVTNRVNYKIDAILGKTKCLKTKPGDLDSCDMAQKRLRCKFEVQFHPRNSQFEVNLAACHRKHIPVTNAPEKQDSV